MDILKAIILGLVQGVTEFLPVSSSGHILLISKLLDFNVDSVTLTLVLHAGTLIAVLIVFWKEFLALFKPPFKKLGYLVLASIPAAVAGILCESAIEGLFSGKYLGAAFLFTAVVLFFAQKMFKKLSEKEIKLPTALAMGLAQAVALAPGISRSGMTISAGLFCGAKKEEVMSFAFLMSLPVIAGGLILELFDGVAIAATNVFPLLAGFVSSIVFGVLAIRLVKKLIKSNNFLPFSIYLVAVAILAFIVM